MTPAERDAIVAKVAYVREWHDVLNHVPTNQPGWCGEDDGISATFCERGLLFGEIDRLTSAIEALRYGSCIGCGAAVDRLVPEATAHTGGCTSECVVFVHGDPNILRRQGRI